MKLSVEFLRHEPCHAVEARRHDEAEHGIETGRIVMTPEGGFTEIRD